MIRRNIVGILNDDIISEENHRPRERIVRCRLNFDLENRRYKDTFRLKPTQVEYVLSGIHSSLAKSTKRGLPLNPEQRLLMTLHWLGCGSQMHLVGLAHNVVQSTVSVIVKEVVEAIVTEIFPQVVKWPENVSNIAEKFLEIGGFPCVAGCVDGTLVKIDAPHNFEETFVDRHGNHSLNVTCICGPDFTFYMANANWPGSCHDSRVFRNTATYQRFEDGWRPFPRAVILGDSAYGRKEWLIPPLNQDPNSDAETRFNRAHKSTRRMIECSFGILKEKFPILNYMRLQPEYAAKVVLACVALHNVARLIDRDNRTVTTTETNDDQDNYNLTEEGDAVEEFAPNTINLLLRYFQR